MYHTMGGRMILTKITVALHSAFWKIPWALAVLMLVCGRYNAVELCMSVRRI